MPPAFGFQSGRRWGAGEACRTLASPSLAYARAMSLTMMAMCWNPRAVRGWRGRQESARRPERTSAETVCESRQPFLEVIGHAQGIGHDGQRGVHGGARREEATIDHVEIVDLVGLAVDIEGGCGWIV